MGECVCNVFMVLLLISPTYADNWERLHQPSSQTNHGLMRDVWDGTVLRRLSAPGQFFCLKTNLALSLNTDGVPLYKSSTWSLWPVFLTILNLPASIRMKAENVLLIGLWYGPSKPPMKLLLEPVLESLRELSISGVVVRTPAGVKTFRSMLVMGVIFLQRLLCCMLNSSMGSMAVLCVFIQGCASGRSVCSDYTSCVRSVYT